MLLQTDKMSVVAQIRHEKWENVKYREGCLPVSGRTGSNQTGGDDMFKPALSYRKNGVPVLSRKMLDETAIGYLADFRPEYLKYPQEVDVDQFAMEYLKLGQDFQYLSNNGSYLGMMVFEDSHMVEVYDEELNEAKYIFEKGNTIVIDKSLLEEGQEARYRFTMGHESAHAIFHRPPADCYQEYLGLFYGEQMAAQEESSSRTVFRCSFADRSFESKSNAEWTDEQWREWQADNFSSSLLMPKPMVFQAVQGMRRDYWDFLAREEMIREVSDIFHVSRAAAEIRLVHLGILMDKRDIWKMPDPEAKEEERLLRLWKAMDGDTWSDGGSGEKKKRRKKL